MNYTNEPSQAALERSSQDAYGVIRLTRSKAAVWTVVDDVARSIVFLKRILIYLFFTLGSVILRDDKISSITKFYSVLFIYVLYEYNRL